MKDLTDLLHGLASELGILYSFALVIIGFVVGVLVWRWFKQGSSISSADSAGEIDDLEAAVKSLVSAISDLWEVASPTSIQRQQDHRDIKSFQSDGSSLWTVIRQRTWGRFLQSPKSSGKNQAASSPKNRLKGSIMSLASQTTKVKYLTSEWPRVNTTVGKSGTNLLSKATRKAETENFSNPSRPGLREGASNAEENREATYPQEQGVEPRETSQADFDVQPTQGPDDQILDLYNKAISDPCAREKFRERYQPVRVGTVNAVERRQNPTAPINAEFRESTEGDFFAFPSSNSNEYLMLPRLGLTIGAVSYNAGALGEMFGNPPYNPEHSYSRYYVRKPAIFTRDDEAWVIKTPGDLDLGPVD